MHGNGRRVRRTSVLDQFGGNAIEGVHAHQQDQGGWAHREFWPIPPGFCSSGITMARHHGEIGREAAMRHRDPGRRWSRDR